MMMYVRHILIRFCLLSTQSSQISILQPLTTRPSGIFKNISLLTDRKDPNHTSLPLQEVEGDFGKFWGVIKVRVGGGMSDCRDRSTILSINFGLFSMI